MHHGRYELLERLGEGESAVVHLARDPAQGGRKVALKLLKHRGEREVARFRREFEVLAGLRHPNLITVLDFGSTADGRLYYTSEYRPGQRTLREAVLEGELAPTFTERLHLAVQVLRGLEFVHTRGLVHRDLKPDNLLIEPREDGLGVRLSDFGLVGAGEGHVAGTPHYMAPEVLRRLRVDRRCDLYSLGVVLYELFAGAVPYDGDDAGAVARKHLEDRPRPLRELAPEVPEELERVVLRLLEKEPAHRFGSANAVIAALAHATGQPFAFETSETKEAYVLSGKFVGRDRELDWLVEGFARATGPRSWSLDPRLFDRRARFAVRRGEGDGSERRRGGDRRAGREVTPQDNPPALAVFLRGASGVGKTRLLDELRRRCQLEGAVVLQGSCRKHLARSYEPFIAIVQEAAQLAGAEHELQEYGWAVSRLLSQSEPEGEDARGVERLRLIDALAEFLIAQSTRRPLVLALENLQWARGETLQLLRHLHRTLVAILAGAESGEDQPRLFVVATYRAEEVHGPELAQALRDLRHDRFFEELALEPLKDDDAAELIRSMLGVPTVPRPFVGRVMEETRGNPLLIELLMEELVGRGVIDRARGLWRLDPARLEALEVPARLHELVMSRLARLPQRALLEWLAVLDRAARPDLVARLAGLPREEALAGLEELAARGLVTRLPDGAYALAHSRVREVVYEALGERTTRHARAAAVLEEGYAQGEGVTDAELAHHLLEAGAGLEAVQWARRAGDAAAALGAAERACELYARALRAVDDQLALVEAEDTKRARPLLEEKHALLRAHVRQLTRQGRHVEARTHTLEGLEVARALGDEHAEVAALSHLGTLNAQLKAGEDAKRYFFEALKTAERLDYGKGIGRVLLGLGDLTLGEGHLEDALEYLERSLEFERDLGDGREISRYLRAIANAHTQQGKLEEALPYVERALEQDLAAADLASRVETLEQLAGLRFRLGDYERAIDAAEQAIAAAEAIDDKPAIARSLLAIGSALERLGERGEARRRLGEALDLTRRLGLGLELAQVLSSVAVMHTQGGDYDEALAAFNEATTLWNTHGDRDGYAVGLLHLGHAYGRRGELERAAACFDAALRVSWELAARASELEATFGRAGVHEASGEVERAREQLDRAVLRAREQKQQRLEALALADLARLLAAQGEGQRGLRAARRARALARELHDEAVTARVSLRGAEVDLLRGALAPALDALRLRSAWLAGARDRALAIEAELAAGDALAEAADWEGAELALRTAHDEARARGLRPLVARALLAQGALRLEQACAGGALAPAAALGAARAVLRAAREEAEACGLRELALRARLGLARLALLEGDAAACEREQAAALAEAAPDQRAVRTEAALLAAEVATAREPEQALVRAEEVEAAGLRGRVRVALLRGAAAARAGLVLEARAALADGKQALEEHLRGLEPADRRRAAAGPLAAALARAREAQGREAGAGAAGEEPAAAAPERALAFLRAAREVQAQVGLAAVRRTLLDRALALFGAQRALLAQLDPTPEHAPEGSGVAWRAVAGRMAPGRDLPEADWTCSSALVERAAAGEVVLVADARADHELGERPSIADLELRSVLALPLRQRGRVEHVLVLEDREAPGRFEPGDVELGELLCELAAHALERARTEEELRTASDALAASRREAARLQVALDGHEAAQSRELDAVKAELAARDVELGRRTRYADLVGASEPMRRVFKLLDKVKSSDVPILIQGESGTGKELVARAVHFGSARRERAFLSINVAALPESLLEAELFGHVKGAFTGADRDKQGLFAAADQGTLFLDEVGEMSPAMQTKLLRVLQEGEVRPIGTRSARKVDVRIVSASNKDLRQLVEEGRFRADLFYRLNVVSVALPPLRERKDDLPLLVDHFLDKIAARSGEERKSVDRKVVDHLLHYDWPGNVRELENELRRLVALSGQRITERDLSPHIRRRQPERLELTTPQEEELPLKDRIERIERRLLIEALTRYENNKTKTAKALGLSRFGFLKKLDKYNLRDDLPG